MYIVQYARRTCFSLGLVLAVSIFQFWIVYHTVAQERYLGLAVVRVSSGYFPIFEYISYSTQEGQLGLGLAVSIFQFWIVYHTVAQ